jgi:hypothetical protein
VEDVQGRCAPLEERWRILREGCLPLERWRPPTLPIAHTCHFGLMGEVAAISHHLATLSSLTVVRPSQVVRPPPLGIFTLCYLYKLASHCKLVGVWDCCLWLYYCNTSIWNKETLEVKKVCYTCVWMLDVICA